MKINLGCGKDYKEMWVNVDIGTDFKVDERYDLNEGLPYPNESVDEILASHIVEHLPKLKYFLDEVHRVLKKGGKVTFKYPHYSGPDSHIAIKHIWSIGLRGLPDVNTLHYSSVKRTFNHSKYRKSRIINWLINISPTYTEKTGLCYRFPIYEVIVEAIK